MQTRFLPFALLGVAGVALAASGWSDYGAAFPGLPCMDGWASCLVDGVGVTPGMVLDSAQRPQPADMRVGFFDLQPLLSFSPFQGLSAYTGALPGSKAAPAAEAPVAEAPVAEAPVAEAPVAEAPVAEAPVRETTRPVAVATAPEAAPVRNAPTQTTRPTAVASNTPEVAPTRPTPVYMAQPTLATTPATTAPSTARTTPPPATTPSTAPATTAPNTARTTTPPAAVATAPVAAPAAPVAAPPVAEMTAPKDDGTCDDLVALEAPAMMGQLGVPKRKCLESRMNTESVQTSKAKISRVLMADAEARGDKADWERLIKNHLENLDRSDPNLCYKYAIFLSHGGASRAGQVIRWADYAMENKSQWVGASYTKNVYSLYRLKAQAANQLWQDAEAEFVTARTDDNQAKSEKYRGMTKNYALEWLDYARASSQDVKTPMAICVSAAGNKEFCEG